MAYLPNPDHDPLIAEINDLTAGIAQAVDDRIIARRSSDRAQAEYCTELLQVYRDERNLLLAKLRKQQRTQRIAR